LKWQRADYTETSYRSKYRAKAEHCIELIQNRLSTLSFERRRQALDMLGIKVWVDGESVEITGGIPVEDDIIATTHSWIRQYQNARKQKEEEKSSPCLLLHSDCQINISKDRTMARRLSHFDPKFLSSTATRHTPDTIART
jgi:hypothetical protein